MRGLIDKKKSNPIVNLISPRSRFTCCGKKGAAHFEMIFSFVFFVGFVFFLFLFLKPEDTTTLSGAVIAGLYDSFEEEVHTNLSNMFLKAEYETGTGNCFIIELPGRIFTYALTDSYVTTLAGTDVNAKLEDVGGELTVSNDSSFFRVAISPEFTDDPIEGCGNLTNYELGNVVERRVVSKSALLAMADEYLNDYEGLRSKLRVPPIFDFAIVVENMTDTIFMEPYLGIPTSAEIMAQDYIVAVLDGNGRLTNEKVTLKIW